MQKRPWFRRAVAALLVLLAASVGLSLALRAGLVHGYLNARLEAAFGRPVEVGHFGFSLLNGARFEADSITVSEDPRFGHEYFLRAERLTTGLRWRSLVRGRFEFGTLSFTRPSLNLVRAVDGHWNVESWLPPPKPADGAVPAPGGSYAPGRLYRIEIDAGRINFKRGVDKHPFALVDVKGHLEQDGAGRWWMDLEARPMRVAVALQEAGALRLRGHIAGTSARLQPAELELTWEGASLADALRLGLGRDYGMRGRLSVKVIARTQASPEPAPPDIKPSRHAQGQPAPETSLGEGSEREAGGTWWSFAATSLVANVHRWDLAQRPGDPALNLTVEALWRPSEATVEFSKCTIDAPRSSISATGRIQWASGFAPEFRFASSGVGFADAFAWYRAFRPGVAEDATLDGYAGFDLAVSGWPLHLNEGTLASAGARLRSSGVGEPIRMGRIAARVVRGRVEFDPTTIALPVSSLAAAEGPARQDNALRVEGTAGRGRSSPRAAASNWEFDLRLAGQTERGQDLLAVARALGHPLNRGWSVDGPVSLQLHWRGSIYPFATTALGSVDLRALELRATYLNRPVSIVGAHIELRPGEQRVTLSTAQAFGARWNGTLRRVGASRAGGTVIPPEWEFDLSADRLDVTELDRWLGPRARPGLLQRMVPFAAPSRDASELDALMDGLRGRGRLNVDEVVIPPLGVRHLRAEAELAGRSITLRRAQADLYEGTVRGSLEAELSGEPRYRFRAQFERVNLKALAEVTATLRERFAGVVSGEVDLAARGIGREALLRSLEGRGTLRMRHAEMHGLDLQATAQDNILHQGTSRFAAGEARFSLAGGRINVEQLHLMNGGEAFQADGSVDFSPALDLQIERLTRPVEHPPRGLTSETFRITGPLDAPRLTPNEPARHADNNR